MLGASPDVLQQLEQGHKQGGQWGKGTRRSGTLAFQEVIHGSGDMPQHPYPTRVPPHPGQGGRTVLRTFPEPRPRQGVPALLSRLQPLQATGTHSDQGKAKVSENTCKPH